ncbi:hypothetical protein [Geothrix oryzisoli]|uniref:hypothetical protein n=1 Tax=Geothrix oryzisoli TaxID=2922721 RepID=UPI001FAE1F6B|nr:hypothetical protein [Geothrix oryzisoli]
MTRPTLVLGAVALAVTLGTGALWMSRRTPGSPPQEENQEPFRASVMGAGRLIELQPPSTPLRTVRWTLPLPGGAAVAQVLTQTGRQQAVLFVQGAPGPTFTVPEPAGTPDSFFQFADLTDAALVPDETLALLYRSSGNAASPALLVVLDLRTQQVRWSQRAPGEHLALAPDRRSLFLYGAGVPVSIYDLANRSASHPPAATTVEPPPEVKGISSLLPLGPQAFLVAHEGGLSTWRQGGWTHLQAPPPSPLGFPQGLGQIAGGPKAGWWQPEPGVLIPLGPNGKPGTPRDLKPLLAEAASLDASLLHLLGEEADGRLWFDLARPSLPAPVPVPVMAPVPAASDPATPEVTVPPPAPPAASPSREDWEAHLNQGLGRLYVWKPGEDHMKLVPVAEAWKRLAPPPGIPGPPEPGSLRPESGTLLCGGPDRMWWLPLKALQP